MPGVSVDAATAPSCEHRAVAAMAAYSSSKNGLGHLCSCFSFYVTEELCLQSKSSNSLQCVPGQTLLKFIPCHIMPLGTQLNL